MNKGGRPSKSFSEQEIKNAIDVSLSYLEAARYLNCSYNTFKKYTELYGLWIKGGKNRAGRKISKQKGVHKKRDNLHKILNGDLNGKRLNLTRLKNRLVKEVIFPEECDQCGFSEKRITDYKAPLMLSFKDSDKTNYKKENLRLLCFNCAFLIDGNLTGRKVTYHSDPITGDIFKELID